MTRDEFIYMLEENLEPDAEMDFLISDRLNGQHILAFLDVRNICMNADVDDSKNYNRGGVVFKIQKEL